MSDSTEQTVILPENAAGQRLDQALAAMFPELSRARLQRLIKAGEVQLNGDSCISKQKVAGGEEVRLNIVPEEIQHEVAPDEIELDVIYEDAHILVINKPLGLVVHPGAGNWRGTLANGLVHAYPELSALQRGGIVHRLDKDTTGLMVVARTEAAQTHLVRQLQARSVKREYDAVVLGVLISGGTVDVPLGRNPRDRKRQSVQPVRMGKAAVTHYRVLERYRGHTLLRCQLETGRTHQIRVHMSHIRHPIVGDQTYGGRLRLPSGLSDEARVTVRDFPRQALHARRLGLIHPDSQKPMQWRAQIPDDMAALIDILRADIDADFDDDWDEDEFDVDVEYQS